MILLCALFCAPTALAEQSQDQQREAQANKTIAQDVMIIIQQEKVRFTAQKAVQEMQLKIFDQSGELIYDSGSITEPELNWPLQDANGRAVKSGMYAYQLSIKEAGAETSRVRRGHFIVDRARERDGQTDRLWITSQNDSSIGTELTVARNEDATVAGASTTISTSTSASTTTNRTSGTNGETQQNGKADDVKADEKDGKAALGANITETGDGNVGIGTTSPSTRLEVVHPATQIRFGFSAADNGGYLISTHPSQAIIAGGGKWNGANWIARDTVASLTAHQNGEIQFFTNGNLAVGNPFGPILRMRIDLNGNVGIGVWPWESPQNLLHVGPGRSSILASRVNAVVASINPDAGIAIAQNSGVNVLLQASSAGGYIGTTSNHPLVLRSNDLDTVIIDNFTTTIRAADLRLGHLSRRGAPGRALVDYGGELAVNFARDWARTTIGSDLNVQGRTTTKALEITGGADFAENFDVNVAETAEEAVTPKVEAGMVVSLDPASPGKLALSTQAYDRRVAGIISGAGGVKPGMVMSQEGSVANGKHPVALSGRVYCWVDASQGAIEVGDLLTTSSTPGHAMKVTDSTKAQGAIIGKAMTGLKEGKGLVLVLVTLQ